MELNRSDTLKNLMRAFSGETQAWARYSFAEQAARTQGYETVARLFAYTGKQEKKHAEVLWNLLRGSGTDTADADGSYPVDPADDVLPLLRRSAGHEFEEADAVYPAFARTAESEGFGPVADTFLALGEAERLHGERFRRLAQRMEQGVLFRGGEGTQWICLQCGHIVSGTEPPAACPLCGHGEGGFLPLELSPFQ